MKYSYSSPPDYALPKRQNGVSLIIVLIMLVIIGLTSASAIRNATSSERATNNIRMQSLAQQYAEAALRYCESEVMKTDSVRIATLKNANIFNDNPAAPGTPLNANYPPSGWSTVDTWTSAGGGASASKTTVAAGKISSANSSFTPTTLPQCVAERSQLPDGSRVTVITSRGFSPDYSREGAATELTTGGSVVWLQSISLI